MVLTMRLLIVGYALLCLIALWFVPASAYGWLGIERDPLAGVFALLLALPWSLLLSLMGDPGPWLALAVLAAGMAMNSWLLWRLQCWLQGRLARGRRS
jgi:hypothetical protein